MVAQGDPDDPIPRPSARIILLDAADRLLLFRSAQVDRETGRPFWFPAGGGVEPGESYEDAARRELFEETGITDAPVGAWLWEREWVGPWAPEGPWFRAQERYFLVRLKRPGAISIENQGEEERAALIEHRWWAFDEIAVSSDIFVPRELGRLLPPVIAGELPATPLRVV